MTIDVDVLQTLDSEQDDAPELAWCTTDWCFTQTLTREPVAA